MTEEAYKEKIAALEQRIRQLEVGLMHDSLTGLKTRAFFEEKTKTNLLNLGNGVNEHRQNWYSNLSMLFADIDLFKSINDTYGHDAGDTVLSMVAQVFVNNLRASDTVARWGGEEIVASLVGASEAVAIKKAEMIRTAVERLSFDFDPLFKVTISIGVVGTNTRMKYEDLIKKADDALYHAKDSGRNKVVAFSELHPENVAVVQHS